MKSYLFADIFNKITVEKQLILIVSFRFYKQISELYQMNTGWLRLWYLLGLSPTVLWAHTHTSDFADYINSAITLYAANWQYQDKSPVHFLWCITCTLCGVSPAHFIWWITCTLSVVYHMYTFCGVSPVHFMWCITCTLSLVYHMYTFCDVLPVHFLWCITCTLSVVYHLYTFCSVSPVHFLWGVI